MLVARKAEVEAHNAGVAAGYVKDLYLQVDEAGKELSKFHADQVRETAVAKAGAGGGNEGVRSRTRGPGALLSSMPCCWKTSLGGRGDGVWGCRRYPCVGGG